MRLPAVVTREAGEVDFAAARLSREALDGRARAASLIAGEHQHAVRIGDTVGHTLDIEGGLLKLRSSVHLWRVQGAADGGVHGDGAGGGEIGIEVVHQGEIDLTGSAQIEWTLLLQRDPCP